MDDQIRRLERRAAAGDYIARQQWRAAVMRAGYPDPDDAGPLTEWEEIQEDYDEIWWHGPKRLRLDWDGEPKPSICKAHHTWGHRGWNNRNSKRKTTRTHRDGSRKNYRLKSPRESKEEVKAPHERRRKKRYGGRGTCRRVYYWHPVTGAFSAWWEITGPNLDE